MSKFNKTVTAEHFAIANKLSKAQKYFDDTRYHQIVKGAQNLWNSNQYKETGKLLESLPTEGELLKQLVEKLRGKSIYRTLRKIEEGKIEKGPQFLKGLGSLLAHVAIEVEKNNKEYRLLYPVIYEKLGEILYID